MEVIDWAVLGATLAFIVLYGIWKTRGSKDVKSYIGGGKSAKWWTIGLSVMATQASAITFLSTPGQAFHDGMGFVQFYFGLPIAMVIICIVFIPLYHKLKVFTAYEFLESRFDVKTRTLTAFLFLLQRGLAAGITIYAPAIILSAVLGWNLILLIVIIGVLVTLYTVSGGTKAVNVTQKQQMAIIFIGMIIVFIVILNLLPDDINFHRTLEIAGENQKLNLLDFSFDLENRYTFWSGLIGGTFLALSYFGTDQSQVQRYLSGKSVREMRLGLLFNGLLKVPMQFFILLVGIMVFVFFQFHSSPLNFNPTAESVVLNSNYKEHYLKLNSELNHLVQERSVYYETGIGNIVKINQSEKKIREEAKQVISQASTESNQKVETNDKDYVFVHFILNYLPKGLVGLLIAVILCAAMSSTASELNALATTTSLDIYKRNFRNKEKDVHYVNSTKWFTFIWGLVAILIACVANLADNLIQLVNIIGSIFYGNVLGIFLLAFFFRFVQSKAVFIAAIITQFIVISGWWWDWMPYLWLNLFGCVLVIIMAVIFQEINGHSGDSKEKLDFTEI